MCLCNLSATNDLLYTLGQIKEVGIINLSRLSRSVESCLNNMYKINRKDL